MDLFRNGFKDGNASTPNVYSLLQGCMTVGEHKIDLEMAQKIPRRIEGEEGAGVWVLPCIPRIVSFEKNMAYTAAPWYAMVKYGLRRLIDKLCEAMGFQYVFVDFGPSASAVRFPILTLSHTRQSLSHSCHSRGM